MTDDTYFPPGPDRPYVPPTPAEVERFMAQHEEAKRRALRTKLAMLIGEFELAGVTGEPLAHLREAFASMRP